MIVVIIQLNEIAFINTLEAQNKKIEVLTRHQGHEARLQDIQVNKRLLPWHVTIVLQEERQRKKEEQQAKEEAAQVIVFLFIVLISWC